MKKEPIALILHGKPFDAAKQSDTASRIRAWLQKSGPGELFGSADIIARLGVPTSTMLGVTPDLRKSGHAEKVGRLNYYGNPATIAELKRRIGE